MLAFFRRNTLDLTLWAVFVVSAALMVKSSPDPWPDFLRRSQFESFFSPFAVANGIIFNIAVGVIVSLIVYVLVVRVPTWQKKRRLKGHLLRRYVDLKEQCLMHFLWACNQPAESTLIERLQKQDEFRAFFKEPVAPDQDRWHAVLNGLTDDYVRSIVRELDLFRGEVDYILTAVEVSDDKVFSFLRHLTEVLQRSRHWSDREDQLKPLSQFMWSVFAGWDVISGYTDRDIVREMIVGI